MKKKVLVLFGINGVGKSTIANEIRRFVPGSSVLSGSEILMSSFRGMDRMQLEILSPEEKMRMLEPAFLNAFLLRREASLLILDTHLVVTIRRNGRLILENVWSEKFAPYVRQAFFIYSNAEEILRRREQDFASTGRRRDLDIEHIKRDQGINLAVFEETIVSAMTAAVIENRDRWLHETISSIMREIA